MINDILSLPEQLRWGIRLELDPIQTGGPIVLIGMGGSAMAATVATLAASPRVPIVVPVSYTHLRAHET